MAVSVSGPGPGRDPGPESLPDPGRVQQQQTLLVPGRRPRGLAFCVIFCNTHNFCVYAGYAWLQLWLPYLKSGLRVKGAGWQLYC